MLLAFAVPSHAVAATAASLEREATEAFNRADYSAVLRLLPSESSEVTPSKALLRLAVQSATKLGRPEEGLEIYDRLVQAAQADDPALLRPLSISFLSAYVRDTKEHLRIAAVQRACGLEPAGPANSLGGWLVGQLTHRASTGRRSACRAGLAAKSQPLRRALQDDSASYALQR